MRRFLLFALPLLWLSLLTACDPGAKSGPRIDFVGATRFTSSDRLLTTVGDTVTSFLYADNRGDKNPLLTHFRVYVTYSPGLGTVDYNILPNVIPKDTTILYLDSTINTREFVFLHQLASRTTSGRETWRFETQNEDGEAKRSYRLTLHNADSLLPYHRYSVVLQAPTSMVRARRSFLNAQDGLALAGYATYTNATFRQMVDLVYLPGTSRAFSLAAPSDPTAQTTLGLKAWVNPKATELRSTAFDATSFAAQDTEAELVSGFNDATPLVPKTRTGSLAETNVVAFRTVDGRKGLILVQDILDTVVPSVLLQVRVTKRAL